MKALASLNPPTVYFVLSGHTHSGHAFAHECKAVLALICWPRKMSKTSTERCTTCRIWDGTQHLPSGALVVGDCRLQTSRALFRVWTMCRSAVAEWSLNVGGKQRESHVCLKTGVCSLERKKRREEGCTFMRHARCVWQTASHCSLAHPCGNDGRLYVLACQRAAKRSARAAVLTDSDNVGCSLRSWALDSNHHRGSDREVRHGPHYFSKCPGRRCGYHVSPHGLRIKSVRPYSDTNTGKQHKTKNSAQQSRRADGCNTGEDQE